ncbi:MAG: NADH-quinone oxidoreductase subunit J [Candidatus Thermoplasmatota archaeon]|jgi:NADH-quinone oxidoreductase subunit J|nr:NADH-quinone oxidoreductase subunit J [Candidatus Thermoplasmatota archaeon]MCL5681355.1 NADH-quinone oxidoreductase subunit J [Candidatus Thermoplasmatota archaeon]
MILLYILGIMGIGFAILSAGSKNLLHSALWLTFLVVDVAAIFFFLENYFISAIEVLVYAGAIVTLILTSVMMSRRYLDAE